MKMTIQMATRKSVATTPTNAPSNGVSCTKTAVDDAKKNKKKDKKYVLINFCF